MVRDYSPPPDALARRGGQVGAQYGPAWVNGESSCPGIRTL